jgi:LmbE family N-acetylglucosaminyl deacetylase
MKISQLIIKLIPFRKLRHKLRDRYFPRKIEITAKTKCLFVAPHPDDEMIGGGGVMCKYPENFAVVVMGSSGTDYKERRAADHAKIRTAEFANVMDALGIKNRWIFQTIGARGIEQMNAHFNEYLKALKTADYDYIFLPVPHDRHRDHAHITNKLFKRILRKNGYKKDLKICFYEVWSLIPNPNVFVDTTEVIERKTKILCLYKSAHVLFQYADISRGLNRYRGTQNNSPFGYAEAFHVDSVHNYLRHDYEVPLNG